MKQESTVSHQTHAVTVLWRGDNVMEKGKGGKKKQGVLQHFLLRRY